MRYITRKIFSLIVAGFTYSTMFHGGGFIAHAHDGLAGIVGSAGGTAQVQPGTTPGQASIQVGFSPGKAEQLVVQTIDAARRSIDVAS